MTSKLTTVAVAIAVAVTAVILLNGASREVVAAQDGSTARSAPTGAASSQPAANRTGGMGGIDRAAAAGKYAFVFVFAQEDEGTLAMRKVFDAAVAKTAGKAQAVVVKVDDPSEKEIVERYRLKMAPMPLALAVAPNGAITGGFPKQFDEAALVDAIASPGMQTCLKALQDRKLVLLCAQNSSTKANEEAMKAAKDFKADVRFANFTEIVPIDPADAGESKFLTQLKVDAATPEAMTVLLAPPGAVVGSFKGAVTKETLASAIMAAMSSGGGCGPSGCAPSGCAPSGASK